MGKSQCLPAAGSCPPHPPCPMVPRTFCESSTNLQSRSFPEHQPSGCPRPFPFRRIESVPPVTMSWARQGAKPCTFTPIQSPGSPEIAAGPLYREEQAQPHPPVGGLAPGAGGGTVSRGASEPLPVCRAVVEGLWLRYQEMPVEEDVGREQRRRVLQTVVWFLLTLLLALFIPDIGKVISVIGGLAACFIFVFPGVDPWRPRSTASLLARAPPWLTCGGEAPPACVVTRHRLWADPGPSTV